MDSNIYINFYNQGGGLIRKPDKITHAGIELKVQGGVFAGFYGKCIGKNDECTAIIIRCG